MDFGLVGSSSVPSPSGFGSAAVSDPETKQKLYGSGLFRKQEKAVTDGGGGDDDEVGSWKSSSKKMAKMSDEDDNDLSGSDNSKSMSVLRSTSYSLFSGDPHHQQNQLLSFSSPKTIAHNAAVTPCFQPSSVSHYSRNAGCNYNSSKSGTYNGFTSSQWIELQHQALIYKYISANMPIPSNLLLPIRKAFESAGFSCLRSNTLGWGGLHLGFSGGGDPEPGRCRRTDGKKWRCSRDAVADQKYCERHMNRGRHRSRKPVEGHQQQQQLLQGHSSAAAAAGAVACGGSSSNKNSSFTLSQQQQLKDSSLNSTSVSGVFLNKNTARDDEKLQGTSSLSWFSSSTDANLKPEDMFLASKHQNQFEVTSRSDQFGFLSSDSLLLNSSSSRLLSTWPCLSQTPSHHQVLHFMDGSSSNVPQSWDSSIGGPLGEALQSSSQSSPTGVLQKTAFVSKSNSSSDGSSPPRADSGRVYEGGSIFYSSDLLGPFSGLVNCSSSLLP